MPIKKADKTINKPIKLMVYADSGAGKTHFALHATPNRTLIFDAESGSDLFEGMVNFDYWTDDEGNKTQSVLELRKCLKYLRSPEGIKNYSTFVLDTITVIWEAIQQDRQDLKVVKAEEKAAKDAEEALKNKKAPKKEEEPEDEFETDLANFNQYDWSSVKKVHKSIILELLNLPQNVIVLAQEKEIVETKANGDIKRTGDFTWDGEKNLKRAFDYVARLTYDDKTDKRTLTLTKSRAQEFKRGMKFENPTFVMLIDKLAEKRGTETTVRQMATSTSNVFDVDEEIPALKASIKAETDRILTSNENAEIRQAVKDLIKEVVGVPNYNAVNDKDKLEELLTKLRERFE